MPQGKLSEQFVYESQVYRGWKISYWIYASPGVDPNTPSPVMVWQDGHRFVFPGNHARLLTVVENLVHQKKIPPMVLVLIAPGYIGDFDNSEYVPNNNVRRMRSILYDTVNDDYNKMVVGEIFPQVGTRIPAAIRRLQPGDWRSIFWRDLFTQRCLVATRGIWQGTFPYWKLHRTAMAARTGQPRASSWT